MHLGKGGQRLEEGLACGECFMANVIRRQTPGHVEDHVAISW
jgi:hypothetical protein